MSCACRRSEADPMTAPFGRSFNVLYFLLMNTSFVSSRIRLHGSTVPSGSHVGTSFMECTQMSTLLSNSATSSSLVKSPFPPISDNAWFNMLSPFVMIFLISTAPSFANSGKCTPSNRFVS